MNWLYYLLEANLYLVLFYGFYRLFLQNETFYNLNRYFLLLSTVISFIVPVLQLGLLKPSISQNLSHINPINPNVDGEEVNWFYLLYLSIAFCFAIKLGLSIYKIVSIWLKGKKHSTGDIILVEVKGESTAFSFFNLLFIHPELADKTAVIKHEMVHIKQKHSVDVLFFELVQITCWFNPIIHFIKKDIKLLHEYIADELTTNADVQKHEYALFLIQNSFGLRAQPITNQIFNQSILKRRINMLNKKRTAGWARLRLLLTLPLTGSMLCISTMAFTKDYGYVDLLPEKSEFLVPIQDNPKVAKTTKIDTLRLKKAKKQDQVKFPPPIVRANKSMKGSKTPPPPVEPPPPHKKDVVKFPPPIVKSDKASKGMKTPPPPVEPPPPPKKDVVRFPPPIIKPDKPKKGAKTPPPPVEPPPGKTAAIAPRIEPNRIGMATSPVLVDQPQTESSAKKSIPRVEPNQRYDKIPPPVEPASKKIQIKLKEGNR
ncbi:M56 family metallopeptidase [Pedobacter sp. Du54]|uniref:M56 family metallopeptidase n=1 Tax=Pedobacter anseongensis TaxID=3133439 RepID=UPI0030B01C9C